MCGGIFNTNLTTNLPRNLQVDYLKSVTISQNYGHESVAPLFWPTLYRDDQRERPQTRNTKDLNASKTFDNFSVNGYTAV